jgi:hypothetical protein
VVLIGDLHVHRRWGHTRHWVAKPRLQTPPGTNIAS